MSVFTQKIMSLNIATLFRYIECISIVNTNNNLLYREVVVKNIDLLISSNKSHFYISLTNPEMLDLIKYRK